MAGVGARTKEKYEAENTCTTSYRARDLSSDQT
jgi:hypothetical protein